MDYIRHNEEVSKVWENFNNGNPIRVPVVARISSCWAICDERLNPKHISFREYTDNPRLMFEKQAELRHFIRFNIPFDQQMGPIDQGYRVLVDSQNYHESAWLGADVVFSGRNIPFAKPILNDDNKNMLFHKGFPDPFGGIMAKEREYYELFKEYARDYVLDGQRVDPDLIGTNGGWTDGPFTLACNVRGTENFCIDLYEDPEFADQLLEFLTEAAIMRIKAWRKYLGQPLKNKAYGFADDSMQLLSTKQYAERVMPYHKRLIEELAYPGASLSIHLCGDATHHFKFLHDELNVMSFDTGFPVDHARIAKELGPEVRIYGGPAAKLFVSATPEQIANETTRIVSSVMPLTKNYVMCEGHNVPPNTPIENIAAMYEAGRLLHY